MDERRGIFGLETEHAILVIPDAAGGFGVRPGGRRSFDDVRRALFECLLAGRKSAVSSGLKGGHFLENGGLAHLEIYVRRQADAPILELATPECRSPWDLLAYSRAFDEILEETGRRSRPALLERGRAGVLAFGKNNRDSRGVGFGCHENYLVRCPPDRLTYLIAALFLPLLIVLFVPTALLVLAGILVFALLFLVLKALGPIGTKVKALGDAAIEKAPVVGETARVLYYLVTTLTFFPAIRAYSTLLRLVALRPFTRHLTSLLVTRQVIAGAGWLNLRSGAYELSQRAGLTRSLGEIVMLGRRKTIFDYKAFLYSPTALFRPTQRMSIAVGDSNLSDVPNLLKVGTAALVIEMVEDGVSFEHLRLRSPLRALREISREGPWKEVRLRDGRTSTAIRIQREYLEAAREHFRGRPAGRMRHDEILALWGATLDRLEDRPMGLSDTLDWVAKKSLLDGAVLSRTNWKTFFAWGRAFEAAGLEAAAGANGVSELADRAPAARRFRVRRLLGAEGVEPADFGIQRDLYFQARKIDLRFHELGEGGGYQRTLESKGLIRRLAEPEAVLRAIQEPPQDTRARVRGYYIRTSRDPSDLRVDWDEIELQRPLRHIPLPDPFGWKLPLD